MTFAKRGRRTLAAEVTNVSPHGFWILIDDREWFVPFKEFPWFADATIQQIARVHRPNHDHLYWPALDVDLSIESLEHPERFPLVSRVGPDKRVGVKGRQTSQTNTKKRRAHTGR